MSRGKRRNGAFLTIYCLSEAGADVARASRLGVIVGKKVFRDAHDRVRAKRLLREIFRKNRRNFKYPSSLIFRFISKPKSLQYKEIESECLSLMKRCELVV
ncbi:MAG: ribonuclease P protein component [Candidatus Omnitrophica bacterium]|nr:ribonuclease P protein component [Candidatus Omnitrophota bacterium]